MRKNNEKKYLGEADHDVVVALYEEAKKHQVKSRHVSVGPTEVTDELYLNALECKIPSLRSAIAVSMEFSVYCAWRDLYNKVGINLRLSAYTKDRVKAMPKKNIKVGNLLMISDNPLKEVDMTEFLRIKEKVEDAHIRTGLETLLRMSRS